MAQKRRKHIPLRTCIVCRQKRPKREMIRVVCSPQGDIQVDPRGKLPGRGAYLCPTVRCWQNLSGQALARALKCPVRAQDVAALQSSARPLLVDMAERPA